MCERTYLDGRMGEADPGRRLRDALRRLMVEHQALDEAARPCGTPLSLPHAHTLLELWTHRAPMSISELASRLRIDRTNVSRLVQRMEAEGQLVRSVADADGRVRTVRLTTHGEEAAARVDRASATHFQRLANELGDMSSGVAGALEDLTAAIRRSRGTNTEQEP